MASRKADPFPKGFKVKSSLGCAVPARDCGTGSHHRHVPRFWGTKRLIFFQSRPTEGFVDFELENGAGISSSTPVDNGNETESITAFLYGDDPDPTSGYLRVQVGK